MFLSSETVILLTNNIIMKELIWYKTKVSNDSKTLKKLRKILEKNYSKSVSETLKITVTKKF
jgi:hypothetical protein